LRGASLTMTVQPIFALRAISALPKSVSLTFTSAVLGRCAHGYPCSCFQHLFCCRPTIKIAVTQRKTVGEYERQKETIYCSTTPQAETVHCTGTIKWIDKASSRTAHTTFSEDAVGILMTKYDSGFVGPVQSTVTSR